MYVIAVEPNKKAHTRIIDDDLNALQKAVGGNIETIYLNDDPIVIVCNSERKLNGKKMNHALTNDNGEIYDILSGTFLVAGVNSNGELTSIPGELVEKYLDRYEILHVFAKGDDGRYTVAELPAKVGDDINESLEIYEEDRAAYIEEMGEEPSEYQHVIWSNSLNVDPELWRGSFNDYIALNNLELDPDNKSELFRYIDKVNMGYWANVKNELGVDVQNEIIEIREDKDDIYSHEKHITYHEIKANKISDCLNADDRAPTYETWYLDDKGDFCCNQLLNCHSCYRIYKPNTTEAQKADLRAKMQDGTATRSDIINATQPLGDEIAKIYGWTSSNDKQQEEENNGNTITVNSKLLEMVVVELETGTGKCCNYREAKDPDITFPDISNPDVYEMQISEMDTPTDTRGQQHYIQKKIAQNKVPIYDYILREMETQLENVQETRTDRQYYILLFAESQDDYFYALSRISQTLIYNDLARKMSLPAKLAVLEKLNNKSQTMQTMLQNDFSELLMRKLARKAQLQSIGTERETRITCILFAVKTKSCQSRSR